MFYVCFEFQEHDDEDHFVEEANMERVGKLVAKSFQDRKDDS